MTTKQFISKVLSGTTTKQQCSSVFRDGDTLYSYGYHYPLVTIIDGNAYVNDRGYSVTTSKHIGWAFSAAAEVVGWGNVYHAPLNRGGSLTKDGITRGAQVELVELTAQMAAKKRKDTQVYRWLETQAERMQATLTAIKG